MICLIFRTSPAQATPEANCAYWHNCRIGIHSETAHVYIPRYITEPCYDCVRTQINPCAVFIHLKEDCHIMPTNKATVIVSISWRIYTAQWMYIQPWYTWLVTILSPLQDCTTVFCAWVEILAWGMWLQCNTSPLENCMALISPTWSGELPQLQRRWNHLLFAPRLSPSHPSNSLAHAHQQQRRSKGSQL